MFEINNTLYQQLFFGENCFTSSLDKIFNEQKFKSIFFVSTKSLLDSPNYRFIKEKIKPNLAGEFPESQAHIPLEIVKKAVQSIPKSLDLIVAFGGSSVVDLAKAIAHELNPKNPSPIIALTTTLSGAEFNSNFGVTDKNIKYSVKNRLTTPRWIILDPILTQNTPNLLWASTGCKLFSDCIEAVCSKSANAYTDQLAYSAIQLINNHLLSSYQNPMNLEAKQNCQIAIPIALQSVLNASAGLIASSRHQLGPRFGIGHGIVSTIVMPHVLNWNFDFAINQFAKLALVLNLSTPSEEPEVLARRFLQHMNDLVLKLNLNKRLSNFIEDKNSLKEVIQPILASPFLQTNPRPVTNEKDIADLLEAAW